MASKKADVQWVANLSSHRVGRQLASHLASVASAQEQSDVHGGDCAAQQALWYERVLVNVLARSIEKQKPFPCGLSVKLPAFVAVLNLSGERFLVGSDSPALIRTLCSHSAVLHQSELKRQLKKFEKHALERTDAVSNFVILTYSMPWQAGIDSVYWHLSACAINTISKVDLIDRILHFSSTSLEPFTGTSVMDIRDATLHIHGTEQPTLRVVDDAAMDAFCESYSATNLDKDPTTTAMATSTAATGSTEAASGAERNEVRMLRSVIDDLRLRSSADQAEISNQKAQFDLVTAELKGLVQKASQASKEWDDMELKHRAKLDQEQQKAKKEIDKLTDKNAALSAEIDEHETAKKQQQREIRKHKAAADALQAKQAADERKSTAKDALHNAALSQHVATISRLEGLLATNGEKTAAALAELERSHAETVRCERETHAAALHKLTIALQSKERICNQLSENNERRDVEVESHKTHQAEQDKRIVDLEAQLLAVMQQLNARPKPIATRNASIGTKKNASTSTHQCAQTQTDRPSSPEKAADPPTAQLPAEGATPAMGTKVMDHAASPSLSYQDALDMLQELVTASGNARASQATPALHAPLSMPMSMSMPMPMPMSMPMPMPHSGYPRPLPYPHFVPGGPYHEANGHVQPRHTPSHRRGPR